MTWVKIDDGFARHPKVVAGGPLAMAMQVAALCYCNRELTDGFVPRPVARTLLDWEIDREDGRRYTVAVSCGMAGDDLHNNWVIDLLVEVGMWSEVPGGYRIHDYLEYNPSRADVEGKRATDLERKRRPAGPSNDSARNPNGIASDSTGPVPVPVPVPIPVPVPVPLRECDAATAPTTDAGASPPQKRATPIPKPRPTTIPDGFEPTEAMLAWANAKPLTPAFVTAETEKFREHFAATGKTMTDWAAAWRKWMLQAVDYAPRGSPNGRAPRMTADEKVAMVLRGRSG